MNDKIKELQREIEAEERRIGNCKHIYGKVYYDPETISVPYGYEMEAHGSDVWHVPSGYRDEEKCRWARKCTICGDVDYTYKQKAVSVEQEPDFG